MERHFFWSDVPFKIIIFHFSRFLLTFNFYPFVRFAHFSLKKKENIPILLIASSSLPASFFSVNDRVKEDRHKLSDHRVRLSLSPFKFIQMLLLLLTLETQFSNLFFGYDVLFLLVLFIKRCIFHGITRRRLFPSHTQYVSISEIL